MSQILADKPEEKLEKPKCVALIHFMMKPCGEDAVGAAYLKGIDKWKPYCIRHLEEAKNLGFPIKFYSDTDLVHPWYEESK